MVLKLPNKNRLFTKGGMILVLASGIVAIAGYMGYTRVMASKNDTSVKVQSVAVTRGPIIASTSSSGSVKALRVADLYFRSSGWVKEVYVKVGDKVTKGQPLAQLDSALLELAVKQAEASVASANAKLATVQKGARPEEIEIARTALDSAKQKLEGMKAGSRLEEIAAATAAVRSAHAKLEDLRAGPKTDEIAAARATVESAQASLKNAQAKLDELMSPAPRDVGGAQARVDSARASLGSAQAKLEQLKNPYPKDLVAAQAKIENSKAALAGAQAKLSELMDRPIKDALLEARQAVENAEYTLREAEQRLAGFLSQFGNVAGGTQFLAAWSSLNSALDKLERDMASNVAQAQIDADTLEVQGAWRRVNAAEQAFNFNGVGFTAGDFAGAQAVVRAAKESLDDARDRLAELDPVPTEAEIEAAKRSVSSAKANLTLAQTELDLLGNPSYGDLQAAHSSVDKSQADLAAAEAALDALGNPSHSALTSAQGALEQTQANLQSAQARLEHLLAGPTAADLAAMEASLAQAESQLAQKISPYTDQDIQTQVNAVLQAQNQLALKERSSTAEDILVAQAAVVQAEVSLVQARYNLENAALVAPFDGVVSAVNESPGSSAVGAGTSGAGGSGAISVIDPSAYGVDVSVDESQVARVDLGQRAVLTVDALPEKRYSGVVVAIAPNSQVQSGVTSYLVSLSLERPEGLKAGMTALANIVYARRDSALLVPARAVKRQGSDQIVTVLVDGKQETRTVKTGITDGSRIEIIEGLEEGAQVVVPGGQSSNSSVQPTGFGAGGGGFGGGAPGASFGGGRRR